jgi:hypothetical protein
MMMLAIRVLVVCLFALFASTRILRGEDTQRDRCEFGIANDGDALIVPVKIDGKEFPFLVDTGATITVFDKKLVRTSPRGTGSYRTAGADQSVSEFDVPAATLETYEFRDLLTTVSGIDLQELRNSIGVDFYGIIGTDFLHRFVVEINFDRGKLVIQKTVADSKLEHLPLIMDEYGSPYIRGKVGNWTESEFLIDTGFISHDSGQIEDRACRYMTSLGQLRRLAEGNSTILGGTIADGVYQASILKIGENEVQHPIFGDGRQNVISLHYLSRYSTVVIDFPAKAIYFQKREKEMDMKDSYNSSGLILSRNDGGVVVESVAQGSSASSAGFMVGDRISAINRRPTSQFRLYQIEKVLNESTVDIELTYTRGKVTSSAALKR